MPSTYTARNRAEKQGAGENANTWGTRCNTNTFDMFDEALDGVVSFALSGSKTLTSNNGATDEARNRVINITGGTGGTITIPNVQKAYLVRNAASGSVTFTTGSGTTADVPTGASQWIFSTGSNVVYTSGSFQPLNANLTAFAGLSLVADRLPYANGSGTLALATLTSAGRALLDDADAAAQRTTLGLGTAATASASDFATITGTETLPNKTLPNPVLTGTPTTDIYAISDGSSVTIDPADGEVQLWTLGANRTPTLSLITTGKAVLLMIDDGSAYTLTLSSVTWLNNDGSAPTLKASGYTPILLFNVGGTIYAWLCGDAG